MGVYLIPYRFVWFPSDGQEKTVDVLVVSLCSYFLRFYTLTRYFFIGFLFFLIPIAEDAKVEEDDVGDLRVNYERRQTEKQLAKEQKDLHEKRLQKLREIKEAQQERKSNTESNSAQNRLEYLMQQAEVFTHFVHGDSKSHGSHSSSSSSNVGATTLSSSKSGSSRSKRGAHGKNTDTNEEDELAEEAEHGAPGVKITKQPSIIQGQLRDYQLEGLNWMVNLHDNNISGILADEMGLGKTLQSISLLGFLKQYRNVNGPHIVLSPKSTLGNWYREFQRFCPTFKVLKLAAENKEERLRLVREELMSNEYDVIITSFETLCIEKAAFRKFAWYYVIIDEAHRIKNEKSVLAQEVRRLDTQYRLLLTGTPLQNNLHELWALLNFLLPDVFSSSEDFDAWFATGGSTEVVKKLHAVIRPFLLRRLKVDVERSLLPKIETKLYIGMSEMQRKWYKFVLTKDTTALNQIGGPDRVRLLNILMQLRKVCNHPYLFEGAEPGPPYFDGPHLWENCGKMLLLSRLLPKLQAQGSRVLIFSQMTRVLDILEDFCRLQAYEYCRIDGNTNSVDREAGMEAFNAPGSSKFVFLLATRAGGLGINLYTADIVILYDSDWNPQADLQAMDRAHRIGQKKQVRVFRLITDRSVEEKIVERAERKLFLDAVVIQQGRLAQQDKALSKGELMNMVKFGADDIFRGEGSTITDEDIDAILTKSEARTKEATDKLQRDMANQLGTMNIEDLLKSDTSKYLYDENDDTGIAGAGLVVPLGEREKRRVVTYDERAYYQTIDGNAQRGRPPGPKLIKPPVMFDYQFFNRKRVEEVVNIENDLMLQRRELEKILKDVRPREAREEKSFVRQRVKELTTPVHEGGAGMGETEATEMANSEWRAKKENLELESARIEKELESLNLSPELQEEKDRLLAEGFSTWSKRDFKIFLESCERHGRINKEAIISECHEILGKPVDDINRYFDVFWSRTQELPDYRKLEERIEKNEAKIKRREALENVIADKVVHSPDPFRSLHIPYGPNKPLTTRGYTEEEDRFLICMLNILGYGAWDALRAEIRRSEQFRFDWFFKSRSSLELQRRCDALIRLLEKEAMDAGTVAGREIANVGGIRGRGRRSVGGVTHATMQHNTGSSSATTVTSTTNTDEPRSKKRSKADNTTTSTTTSAPSNDQDGMDDDDI